MSETQKEQGELHELAGGWITERRGTPIPGFLKLAYVGFSVFGLAYLFQYAMGEVDHATRGPLVQQFNAITDKPSSLWLGALAVIIGLFVVGLLWYALVRKGEADE
jgi:hypothetical protein